MKRHHLIVLLALSICSYAANNIIKARMNEKAEALISRRPDPVIVQKNIPGETKLLHDKEETHAPQSPASETFIPNGISNAKKAHPAQEITTIEAPIAGNMGNAALSFPVKIPAGRKGMQPEISISYNSESGNGWLGLGWNIITPAVSIETRWGVPRYDASLETETYLLNNQQLGPVAHRADAVARTSEKEFHPRVEDAFEKIIRHNNSPSAYWWEVIDKSGTRNFYGGNTSTGVDASAVLTDANGNIAYWALTESRDANENFVKYRYAKVSDPGITGGSAGQDLYLSSITYTGNGSTEGKYSIEFTRDRQLNETKRQDVIISARWGFKQVCADLLRKIAVKYNGQNIRSYELNYAQGAFYKTLLQSVSEFNAGGALFTTHSFEYYNDVQPNGSYQPLAGSENWTPQVDNVRGTFLNPIPLFSDSASMLGGNKSIGGGFGMAITLGPFDANLALKTNTAGVNFGFNYATNEGMLALVDINGDGLADKVYKKNGVLSFRPNQSGPDGTTTFGDKKPVNGISDFNKGETFIGEIGLESHFGIFAGFEYARTEDITSIYFSDVNGDLLVDIVKDGRVYFNHLDSNGNPTFTLSSGDTPSPIDAASGIDGSIVENDPVAYQKSIDDNPLHDVVKVWVAPFNGTVSITQNVALIQDTSPEAQAYTAADGVRVAIQFKGSELWSTDIAANDFTPKTPSGVGAIAVQKGDRIYFRVQSKFNGAYDQVSWSPQVTYSNHVAGLNDANALPLFQFKSNTDFLISGALSTGMSINGQVKITGDFVKPVTSDDIVVRIIKKSVGISTPVFVQTLLWNQATTIPISIDVPVLKNDELYFSVLCNTNIDWTLLQWNPFVYYNSTTDPAITQLFNSNGDPLLFAHPTVDFQSYNKAIKPSLSWTAPASDTFSIFAKPDMNFTLQSGQIIFSIKKQNELVAKQVIPVTLGVVEAHPALSLILNSGDKLFFEYHLQNEKLADAIDTSYVIVDADPGNPENLIAGLHTIDNSFIFGPLYRHWGQFSYNGNRTRATQPIIEADLKLDESLTDDTPPSIDLSTATTGDEMQDMYDSEGGNKPQEDKFIYLVPDNEHKYWIGYDNLTYVKKDIISSSRMGKDDLTPVNPISVSSAGAGSGAVGIKKVSNTDNFSLAAGIGPAGVSTSFGYTKFVYDFNDINGDRYPDILSTSKIQYTRPYGGLEPSAKSFSFGDVIRADHFSIGFTLGGTFLKSNASNEKATPKGAKASNAANQAGISAGISGNFNYNRDSTAYAWMDINGDDLPDRVYRNGSVELNLGYSFLPAEQWGYSGVSDGYAYSYGGGVSINIGAYSISAGVGFSRTENETERTLQDMNGDGLPDYIAGISPLRVAINKGNGFAAPVNWTGADAIHKGVSTGECINAAFTIGFPIIPIAPVVKLCINPSVSVFQGADKTKTEFEDIDGDGFVDFLQSDADNNLMVSRSTIKRTNKLKKVNRPLGARFTLDYKRTGNTYNMPNTVWALASVDVYDGLAGDGADHMLSTFRYENGRYNRHEREFYGFGKVTTSEHDTQNSDVVYRKTEDEYVNDNFYEKGLLKSTVLKDGAGNKFTETINTYELKNIQTGATLPASIKDSDDGSAFPALTARQELFYEGGAVAGKTTSFSYTYDALGNITLYKDFGDAGASDDVSVAMSYHSLPAKYIMNVASSVTVAGSGQTYRQRATSIDNKGNVIERRNYLESGDVATTNMQYDGFGNLTKLTRPQNATGQRLSYTYEYDGEVQTYLTKTTDSYGYTSSSTYDVRFGAILSLTDYNGQQTLITVDNAGRVTTIKGPFEIAAGQAFTLAYEYHPEAAVPWALTKQFDPANPANILESATFCDGLKRIVQTKKDGAIFKGANMPDEEVMIVSGADKYDAFGRTTVIYHPTTEPKGTTGVMNAGIDNIPPTRMVYDVLDRVIADTMPDEVVTRMIYGFGNDRDGQMQFSEKMSDGNGISTEKFINVRKLLKASKQQYSQGSDVWTSFDYNPVDELIKVTDDAGNKIISTYDRLGRIVSVNHPDGGITTAEYDLNNNRTQVKTANLQGGTGIKYTYDFERLTKITYPQNPQNNVLLTWGGAGSPFFRTGKLVKKEDATGSQEYFYNALGAITKNKRIINIPGNLPLTYTTEWTYDTWSRLRSMIYPDGETLTYNYNAGGLMHDMSGIKSGTVYNYMPQEGFDKFEQKVYVRYGNGTETHKEYEPERRHLHNVVTTAASGRVIIDNHYTYDNVDNLLRIENAAPTPPSNLMGGGSDYQYTYDDLYRLTNATGKFRGNTHEHRYTLSMVYDKLSSIVAKNQVHQRRANSETNWVQQNQTTYSYNYNYNTNGKPHAPVHIGTNAYTYDANGNQTGWKHDVSAQNRKITWDEENRMKTLSDNGDLFTYTYDAAGERVLKSNSGDKISVNGKPAAKSSGLGNYTIYVNPFMVVRSGGFTKHFYSDDSRIASKLGESGNGNSNGNGSTGGGNGNNQEAFQFYFHSDHVGNTAFVTDRLGEVYQHIEYFPFGEILVHEHSNQERTPYLYNGKEQDEETGLYYYGARYYDATTSTWQRVDPYWQLPDEINKSPYVYVLNNPLLYSDPDGKSSHIIKGTIGIGGKHGQTKQASKKGEVESDHIPPYDAMRRGGIKRSRDQMGAVTVPREFHRAVITTGSGKASKEFRDEQAEMIEDDRFADAVEVNLEDYGEKADQFKLTKKQRESIVEGIDDMLEFQVGQDWLTKKEKEHLRKVARKQLKVKGKKKSS